MHGDRLDDGRFRHRRRRAVQFVLVLGVEAAQAFVADLVARQVEGHPSVAQADDAREEVERDLDLVQGRHHRRAPLFGRQGQRVDGLARARRVERRQGFVDQPQAGRREQGAGEADALALAAGKAVDPLEQLVGEGEVLEEFGRGYMLGDRLLRPSMVKVAKG